MTRCPVPEVSVVIGAYNAADTLGACLDSLLSQEGVDLEVIVVNDGSKDATGAMLDEAARRDPRVRPIHQENQGLTRALLRGCSETRGEFIARQDADDLSLPGRLAAQLARARAPDRPVLVAVGCGCVTEEGDLLYLTQPPAEDAEARRKILEEGRAICCHGALLFRRDVYEQIGGYRPVFYYSQDIDLIVRLAECGTVSGIPRRLYDFAYSPTGISGLHIERQLRFFNLSREAQRARAAGRDEAPFLEQAEAFRRQCLESRGRGGGGKRDPSAGYFFMASCLRRTAPLRARHFYRQAWRHRPFSPRYALRYLLSLLPANPSPQGTP